MALSGSSREHVCLSARFLWPRSGLDAAWERFEASPCPALGRASFEGTRRLRVLCGLVHATEPLSMCPAPLAVS